MSSEEESSNEYESDEEIEEVEEESDDESEEEGPIEEEVKPMKTKRTKKQKDSTKPKRGMSAFFFYSNANRARVKEENPSIAFGDVAKILSADYKKLTEKEKKKWIKLAEKDKIRYKEEMKNYVPPDSDSDEGGKKKKKKKAKKDPNKPKRGQTAYFLYSNAIRSKVKDENPKATFGDIAKIISAKYKSMSNEERKKYESLAAKDKARYQREMAEYNA